VFPHSVSEGSLIGQPENEPAYALPRFLTLWKLTSLIGNPTEHAALPLRNIFRTAFLAGNWESFSCHLRLFLTRLEGETAGSGS
jgi:hypothetical protein